jgi:pilus assembly protein Flp/PilA
MGVRGPIGFLPLHFVLSKHNAQNTHPARAGILKTENLKMNSILFMLNSKVRALITNEEGQDLVEYALLVALVSLAAVASLNGLAAAISGVFSNISTSLGSAV